MPASNRAKLIGKLHTALKKHYKVPPAQPTRPLLEHVLYASLLEDCPADLADEGLAKCEQDFFDWNEVRVTTITELSQVLSRLPDPHKAATRLKGNLQAIFEEFYTFDLDHLKKENLGKAVAKFEQMPGMTPFVLNYTVQHGLGGHAIPIDYSAMVVMMVAGIASQSEAASRKVPGLERAIPKSKGIEFASLLHQCAVTLHENPKDKSGRAVLEAVHKGASEELDQWLVHKKEVKQRAAQRKADERAAAELEAESQAASEESSAAAAKKAPVKKSSDKKTATKKPAAGKPATKAGKGKTAASAGPSGVAKEASKKAPAAKETPPAAKKPAASKKKSSGSKKATGAQSGSAAGSSKKKPSKKASAKSGSAGKVTAGKSKKSTGRKLTKRKPR